MKQTMNKTQREYMEAKARVAALVDRQKQMERAYIATHGIVNPDGSTPERIYCIEDDDVFERANEESDAEIVACGLEAERSAASAALRAAEDGLIGFGLSLVPAGVRATLEKKAKESHAVRLKLIELAFRLDVSTVPKQASGRRTDHD